MEKSGNILVIPVEGDLDVASVPRVRACILDGIQSGVRRVILSLADVSYVDSAGMGLIMGAASKLRDAGGLLSLVNVDSSIYRMLVINRLVDFIPVSGHGPKPPIPALDPTVRPLWHSTMRVNPERLSEARQRVEELFAKTELTSDEVFDLTLAAGEALGNAVDHTCAEGVLLSVWVYPDRVVVEVTDCGCGYESGDADGDGGTDAEGAGESPCERGRGIKLMRLLADSVEIRRKRSGTGTVVRLVKLFTPMAANRA